MRDIRRGTTGLYVVGKPKGMLEGGNIDLSKRRRVRNPHGGYSTVLSKSFQIDGKEVLLPLVEGDRIVKDHEAVENYVRTGKHLGKFSSARHADRYATSLHFQQQRAYRKGR